MGARGWMENWGRGEMIEMFFIWLLGPNLAVILGWSAFGIFMVGTTISLVARAESGKWWWQ